jgi:uncharacterized membrane protein
MFPDAWSFGYKLMLFLHILSVIVAFAPAFVWPVVSVQLKKKGKPVGPSIGELAAGNTTKIHGPALVLVGLFGFGLVGMSKPAHAANADAVWEFSQAWVSIALLCWFLMLGLLFGMMLPAEKKAAAGDEGAEKIISAVGGVLHLLLAVVLVMMIWKPGF